jgi:hypothetical protein
MTTITDIPVEVWQLISESGYNYNFVRLQTLCLRETCKYLSKIKLKPPTEPGRKKTIPFNLALGYWYENLVYWMYDIGARPNANSTVVASVRDDATALRYLHSIGEIFTSDDLFIPVLWSKIENIEFIRSTGVDLINALMVAAVYNNSYESFVYLYQSGKLTVDEFTLREIGQSGRIKIAKFILDAKTDHDTCTIIATAAAGGNQLECLQLCASKWTLTSLDISMAAAEYGSYDCLKLAHENDKIGRAHV